MSAREDMALDIAGHRVGNGDVIRYEEAKLVADSLLAAGYRKPRTITTADELNDETAPLTVVRSADGLILEKNFGWWQETGTRDLTTVDDIALPATVLYEAVQ